MNNLDRILDEIRKEAAAASGDFDADQLTDLTMGIMNLVDKGSSQINKDVKNLIEQSSRAGAVT